MRRHTFEIPFEKANENLSAFLIGKGVDCKGTYIKVVLTTQDMKGPSENGADILPLIKAYAKSPCFCIVMRESRYMDTTERTLTRKQRNGFLKKLFVKGGKSLPTGPCANSTWLRYMRTAMNALFICRGPTRFVLTFQVNHVFAEDWMEGGEDLDGTVKDQTFQFNDIVMSSCLQPTRRRDGSSSQVSRWSRSCTKSRSRNGPRMADRTGIGVGRGMLQESHHDW
ncbi:hypothetical protein CC86DRAFT_462672 [Ophiobolus disseminans]|uniref:Uncharacterized protein n=1 Tax=Ophiobolus disseminans TaxID=1469910 RepID=A0A6A7AGF7_9PLEO|nr:hypothetical protein CC86DRAFT_462672 [Ophiobolus disseminans]